jgi:hypothetical protein
MMGPGYVWLTDTLLEDTNSGIEGNFSGSLQPLLQAWYLHGGSAQNYEITRGMPNFLTEM